MRRNYSLIVYFLLVLLIILFLAVIIYIPILAEQSYGPPNSDLNLIDRYNYAISLLWNDDDLTSPVSPAGDDQNFVIEPGDSVYQISDNLEILGLIRNSKIFRIFLVWKDLDTTVQAGDYILNPGMTGIEIAYALQDATPTDVSISVWAGWRKEEIADSLITSGLNISPEEFLDAVNNPRISLDFLPDNTSAEGFLFPGTYSIPRDTNADQLVSILIQNFSLYFTIELQENLQRHGLDIYQAVILASIVEREAIVPEEQPMIASVFYNRLNNGMKLDSDPTVQYAVGYDDENGNWWKNPLTLQDLSIDSPYNTYIYPNLPPSPISNPGLSALRAVAYPAQTPYFYFRAQCDGSGLHFFSETYEQHLLKGCK
ncbi:MAG: endolytic transglycosylase MltG [Chloroflexota bacterium]